jgi:hypothetical protein
VKGIDGFKCRDSRSKLDMVVNLRMEGKKGDKKIIILEAIYREWLNKNPKKTSHN